jgi:hypothetical protein
MLGVLGAARGVINGNSGEDEDFGMDDEMESWEKDVQTGLAGCC